jgi:hypothetical protein
MICTEEWKMARDWDSSMPQQSKCSGGGESDGEELVVLKRWTPGKRRKRACCIDE